MHLKGNILAQFHPIIEDFLNKEYNKRNNKTNAIFLDYIAFEKQIKDIYRDSNAIRMALRKL